MEYDELEALIIFTNRLSGMVESGINIATCMDNLTDCPAPYGSEAIRIKQTILHGKSVSDALLENPPLYPSFYTFMTHAGETGGIMEVFFRRTVELMIKERELINHSDEQPFLCSFDKAPFSDWNLLTEYQKSITQLLFCETLANLISAWAPVDTAINLVKDLLPADKKPQIDQMISQFRARQQYPEEKLTGMNLSRDEQRRLLNEDLKNLKNVLTPDNLDFLPLFVQEIIAINISEGSAIHGLTKAAEIMERELEYKISL